MAETIPTWLCRTWSRSYRRSTGRIDVVLSTHRYADHMGGLQRIVEGFDVGTIVDSGVPHDSTIYETGRS